MEPPFPPALARPNAAELKSAFFGPECARVITLATARRPNDRNRDARDFAGRTIAIHCDLNSCAEISIK
jgi:hypothetical protein